MDSIDGCRFSHRGGFGLRRQERSSGARGSGKTGDPTGSAKRAEDDGGYGQRRREPRKENVRSQGRDKKIADGTTRRQLSLTPALVANFRRDLENHAVQLWRRIAQRQNLLAK